CAIPRASASGATKLLVVVHERLSDWRIGEAEALLTLMTAVFPSHTEVRRARARLAYLQGEYDEAVRLIRVVPPVVGTTDVSRLTRTIEAALAETRGWVTHRSRSGNFVFRCPPGLDELLVPYAEEALERARLALGADLGILPDGPVRVELLPGADSLARLSPLTEDEVRRTGTIALSHDRKLMAVTPRALISGYAWLDTLVHEYVHYVIEVRARNRVPLWLHEGLARYAQARWRKPFPKALVPRDAHLLAEGLAAGALVPLDRMMPSFAKLRDQREAALAYAQVTSMVLRLQGRRGPAGLRALIEHHAAGRSTDEALRLVDGVDLKVFLARWRRDLLRDPPRRLPYFEHPALRWRDGAAKTPPAMPEGPVARHRRLGALLRARGRPEAARVAYERAFVASGQSHGRIGNTLARLLIELGRPREAARVASQALRFNEEHAGLFVALARAEAASGHPQEAEAAWRLANSVDPFDPEIHCSLAKLLRARAAQAEDAAREQAVCDRLKSEESGPLR
ncbi:MAG: hypothetical protein RBU30_10855, partial [Polyangia bacterium]|nr:hypothetical protein [Polyangia bacterium]